MFHYIDYGLTKWQYGKIQPWVIDNSYIKYTHCIIILYTSYKQVKWTHKKQQNKYNMYFIDSNNQW